MVSGLTPPDKKRDFSELSERVDDLRDSVRFKGASTNIVDTGFGFGASSPEVAPISGIFTLEPSIHNIGVELSWTGATGVIDGGDTVDSDSSVWQGNFGFTISGTDLDGTGFIENLSSTIITDIPQTLNIGASWTGAVYTNGTLKENAILLTSTSVLLDDINGDPTLKWIRGLFKDGSIVLLKPINGKSITLTTGGNIDINSDISIGDSSFALMQFHINNINKDADGTWSVVGAGGGGGGSGGAGTWKSPCRVASTVNNPTHPLWSNNIDGTALVEGDRFLVKDQDVGQDNGIYVVGGIILGLHTAVRATDFDADAEVVSETFTAIEEGVIHKEQLWHLITVNPLTVGTTVQVWQEFGSAGSGALPIGTENQHLEWSDSAVAWEARTNLEFGATGPFANAGFIRFTNATAVIAWRNQLNDGNMAMKVTSSDWFDITHDKDILEDSSVKFRLRAQSPFSSFSGNPAFEIVQLPDDNNRIDGEPFFATEMRYPALLNIWRGHTGVGSTNVLTLDHKGDMNHWNNGGYQIKFLRFFEFGSPLGTGDGAMISRFSAPDGDSPDGDGNLGGLHYDIENTTFSHVFRVGDGTSTMFSDPPAGLKNPPITKWKITQDRNVTTQPIEFSYRWFDSLVEADHVGPVTEPRIFRSVEGMYIQLGIDGGLGGFGNIKFIDNAGLTSFTDDGRINFDFDLRRTKFNFQTGGFHLRTNNDNGNSVIFYPPFGDHNISHLDVNDAVFVVLEETFPAGGMVFVGGNAGINQLMKLAEAQTNIYETLDMSKRGALSFSPPIEGSDIINTGDIIPFAGVLSDVGMFDNRYENMFASQQVFTPLVGEVTARTEYTDFIIREKLFGDGFFVVDIDDQLRFSVLTNDALFTVPVRIDSPDNEFNYLQLSEKFQDPPVPTNRSGRLFSKEASGSTEVHPWWFGDNMSNAVDLITGSIGGGGDIDLNCNNLLSVSGIFFCEAPAVILSKPVGLEYAVGSNQTHNFGTIGNPVMEIYFDKVDFKNNFLEDVNSIRFGGVGLLKSIATSGDNLLYATVQNGLHTFTVDGAPFMSVGFKVSSAQDLIQCFRFLELNNNTIQGVNDIFFEDPNISFETFAGGLIYSVPLTQAHLFANGNDITMSMYSSITVWENVQHYGNYYHDYTKRLAPSGAVAGTRRLFVNENNNDEISVIRSDGVIVSLENPAGGGGDGTAFTDRVVAWLEIPENGIAYPKVYKMESGSDLKITGYVMPFGATTSVLNCKAEMPKDLSDTPNVKVRIAYITLGTGSSDTLALEVLWKTVGDEETFGGSFTGLTIVAEDVADTLDTKGIKVFNLTGTFEEDDSIMFQIKRHPTHVDDTYTSDIMIYGAWLEVNRVGEEP